MLDTSSKMSLKLSCLRACDNDVDKARELYDFLVDGLGDLPDVVPTPPGTFDVVKQSAADIFAWLGNHRDDIAQGVAFVQSLRKTAEAVPNVEPIPKL